MIITKMALPRRTFLRGMGVTLALPLLDAMVPALSAMAKTAASRSAGSGSSTSPNGATMSALDADGRRPRSTSCRRRSAAGAVPGPGVVPTGLSQKQAEAFGDGNGEHSRAGTVWLSGVHPKHTEGADVRNGHHRRPARGAGARQGHAAAVARDGARAELSRRQLRQRLQLRLLEHASRGARRPTPLPMETNPRIVFERLFGDGGSAAAAARADARRPQHPRLGR